MDGSAVATKADITMIMNEIGKLYDATERWKRDLRDEMFGIMDNWKTSMLGEIKEHFDLTSENIRHDLAGANRGKIEVLSDRSENHERRIGRLERHANLR